MENATRYTIAGIAIALTGAITLYFSQPGQPITICDNTGTCQDFTQQQYDQIRDDLAEKIRNNTPLEMDEYYLAVGILSRELQPTTVISNVENTADLREKVADMISN